jgi:tRNA A37 methylthiotransferase MiaB
MPSGPAIFVKGTSVCHPSLMGAAQVRKYLELNGYRVVDSPVEADVCLLFTCVFRSVSEFIGFHYASKLLEANPSLRIIFAGCGPKALPQDYGEWESFEGYRGVEGLFPPRGVPFSDVPLEGGPGPLYGLLPSRLFRELFSGGHTPLLDAIGRVDREFLMHLLRGEVLENMDHVDDSYHVLATEGCRFRCSYCLVWKATAPFHSVPLERVLAQVREGYSQGFRRFKLVSNDLSSYGTDLPGRPSLKGLVGRLLDDFPGTELGANYFPPAAVNQVFADGDHADRFFYLLVPMQSASERMLKLMNRPRNLTELSASLGKLREHYQGPLGAEVMYGLPGETKKDVIETVRYVRDAGFDFMAIYKFSPRPGTPLGDEEPCEDAGGHGAVLEEANRFLKARFLARSLELFSDRNFVSRVRVRPVAGSVFSHPGVPGFSVTVKQGGDAEMILRKEADAEALEIRVPLPAGAAGKAHEVFGGLLPSGKH